MVDKEKILAGRKAVDAYRTAHAQLHSKPWHKGIPEEHAPLLKALINALDGLGFASTEPRWIPDRQEFILPHFEPDKTLAKFFDASKQLKDGWE